jgi:hypothetical protein
MTKWQNITISVLLLLAISYCSSNYKYIENYQKKFPLKIALLADSQITTNKAVFNYGFRSKLADKFINVAVRPPAIEYLSPLMLEYFLNGIKDERPDLAIYLGDGANSGCKDEIEILFKYLSQFRKESKIPIYYIIGNHDYLGASNQTKISERQNLCDNGFNDNPILSKNDLIKIIKKFNEESAKIDKNLKYQEIYHLDQITNQQKEHFYSYYGAILNYNKNNLNIDLLLLDSSDYANSIFKPQELWGIKGGISYKKSKYRDNSQLDDFINKSKNNKIDYRLIISHYQPEKNFTPSILQDDLSKLLIAHNNYWLSAHTHHYRPEVKKYKIGKIFRVKNEFQGLNIGSTTDYLPHSVILEKKNGKNRILDDNLGYKIIKFKKEQAKCNKIFDYVKSNKSKFIKVNNSYDFKTILGIDKSYRKHDWSGVDIKKSRDNIDILLKNYHQIGNDINQHNIISCITRTASKNELSYWDKLKIMMGFDSIFN